MTVLGPLRARSRRTTSSIGILSIGILLRGRYFVGMLGTPRYEVAVAVLGDRRVDQLVDHVIRPSPMQRAYSTSVSRFGSCNRQMCRTYFTRFGRPLIKGMVHLLR